MLTALIILVAQDMPLENQIFESLEPLAEMQVNAAPGMQTAFSVERIQAQASGQFQHANTTPLVIVEGRLPQREGEFEEDPFFPQTNQKPPGPRRPALLLASVAIAFSPSAMGILIAYLARTKSQIGG